MEIQGWERNRRIVLKNITMLYKVIPSFSLLEKNQHVQYMQGLNSFLLLTWVSPLYGLPALPVWSPPEPALMWLMTKSTMMLTPAALHLSTISLNWSRSPDLDPKMYETGWYLVHQAPPWICSLGGDTCTPQKPLGPRNSSHSLATAPHDHSNKWTTTCLSSQLGKS